MKRHTGLPPLINKSTKMIILGTFPSRRSLLQQEYYADGRNHFWKIIKLILPDFDDSSYQSKIKCLLQNGIGLWDLIESCERTESSLDKHIKNPIFNDVTSFLNENKIEKYYFNREANKSILFVNRNKER